MTGAPELSVVVPTDCYETVAEVIRSLEAQSAAGSIELVLVTPAAERIASERLEHARFHGVRVVQVSRLDPLMAATAAGIRAATAPVVAIGETHSYPEEGWAAALIDAHRAPWAAVGPAITNANPGSLISWANLYLDYGPFVEITKGGVAGNVPLHNGSFKRAVLLEYGPRLTDALASPVELVEDLKSRGHELFLEPAARTAHLNVSRPGPWLAERFHAGRTMAAERARAWTAARRLAYAAAAPLIPAVLLTRALRHMRASRRGSMLLPRILPELLISLAVSAAGEFFGYASGKGGSARRLHAMELHRIQFVR
jgi:hypothetical protein